jgi:hypothetical protein
MFRRHRIEDAPGIQKSTGMTFIFTGVRLLVSRVEGSRVFELTFGDHFSSRLDIWQTNYFNDWGVLDSTLLRHPQTRTRHFTGFMLWTCDQLFQWLRYLVLHFTQVPHTYSVKRPPRNLMGLVFCKDEFHQIFSHTDLCSPVVLSSLPSVCVMDFIISW